MKYFWIIFSFVLLIMSIFHPMKDRQDYWSPGIMCAILFYVIDTKDDVRELKSGKRN